MKLLYTHDDRLLVGNVKNIVEAAGFDVCFKNDVLAGAVGRGASSMDVWLEVWIVNDNEYDAALSLIETTLSEDVEADWICLKCAESNGPSFKVCWNCQEQNPDNSTANS